MIDTLNSTHYLPVLPETSCIYPEGIREKSTHEFKKKRSNASGTEVSSKDNEEKSTHVKGEKRAQSVKKYLGRE